MEGEKGMLREFSKEQSSGKRKEVAEKIREKRSAHFERAHAIDARVRELKAQAETHRLHADEAVVAVTGLETELAEEEVKIFARAMKLFGKQSGASQRIRETIAKTTTARDAMLDTYNQFQESIHALELEREDHRALKETKELLKSFYAKQSERWNTYEREDREARDLQNVMRNHDAIFIHDLHPTFVPKKNSPLFENTNWKTKLNVLLAL